MKIIVESYGIKNTITFPNDGVEIEEVISLFTTMLMSMTFSLSTILDGYKAEIQNRTEEVELCDTKEEYNKQD